ncbi:gas vesicle protein GvpO [Haladaptatus sp. CMAA 1911]|uniref:gas vesicle protein GvpO n=1 Tax=unclassified Haladaptatus TaxID=2622732 RepID=UPI0037550B5D
MTEQTSGSETREFDDVLDRLSAAVEEREDDGSTGDAGSEGSVDVEEIIDSEGGIDLYDARDVGRAVAGDLIGSPLDNVVEVEEQDEDGWRVVAEVVERNSIPDTQDILGRYVISLGPDGEVRGYGRAGRYRRGRVETQNEIFDVEER